MTTQITKAVGLALTTMLGASAVQATPFFIDVGTNYSPTLPGGTALPDGTTANGETTTGYFEEMLLNYWSTTSLTDTNNNGIFDTGDTVVGTGGIDNTPVTATAGTIASDPGEAIAAGNLIGTNSAQENKVTDFSPTYDGTSGSSTNGYGSPLWYLTFGWNDLQGTVNSTGGISYTSGSINFYLYDVLNADPMIQIMELEVTSGGTNAIGQSLNLQGDIDFAGLDLSLSTSIGTSTLGGLFNFNQGSFGDLWTDGLVEIKATNNQNTEPFWYTGLTPLTTPGGFNVLAYDNYDPLSTTLATASLSGRHDGSVAFGVPEPASLALLGAGLLGFGAFARKKAAS